MARRRNRADAQLVEDGHVETLAEAAARIIRGEVMVTDPRGRERKVAKPGESIVEGSQFRILGVPRRFVSRAGDKLEAALEHFAIEVEGRICADVGASTGGFTDCLLRRGARRVHAVDVAYGILAWSVRQDARVVVHERTHARALDAAQLGGPVDLVVVDLSFIAVAPLLAGLAALLAPAGELVVLVKPQFELPASAVPEGGVVRDEADRVAALDAVREAARRCGLVDGGALASPVPGADGNVEWLARFRCP